MDIFESSGPHGNAQPNSGAETPSKSDLRDRILKEAAESLKTSPKRPGYPWTKNPLPYTAAWRYNEPNNIKEVPIAPYRGCGPHEWTVGPDVEPSELLALSQGGSTNTNIDPVFQELDLLHQQAEDRRQDGIFDNASASYGNIDQCTTQPFLQSSTMTTPHIFTYDGAQYAPSSPWSFDIDQRLERLRDPETRKVTELQLIKEVEGIYAGLIQVEERCIDSIRQQSPAKPEKLSGEQWQALIALQRELVDEYHDFFLATRHPVASPALRNLAHKYRLPERMWSHGVHAFLELLQQRLPHEIDHMLTFVKLGYEMIEKLMQSLPDLSSHWHECLEDLHAYESLLRDPASWVSSESRGDSQRREESGVGRNPLVDDHMAALEQAPEANYMGEFQPGLFTMSTDDIWILTGWYHLGRKLARSLKTYSTVFKILTLQILV